MFTTAVRVERDLGVPSVSLNTLTGHRSCAPEDCSGQVASPPQGLVPVPGVFPAGAILHLLETRLQAITLSPYRADLPARHPIRLGTAAGFLACYCPLHLSDLGSAIRSRDNLLSSLPAARAIQQCASWRTDYYGHSVAIGLAPRRRSRGTSSPYVRARHRPPTHLLDRPRWAAPRATEAAPSHGSCQGMTRHRFQASFRRVRTFTAGDWASGNPALAISREPRSTPPWTPPGGHHFPGMLLSPSGFPSR
jgi:hypothetical protein